MQEFRDYSIRSQPKPLCAGCNSAEYMVLVDIEWAPEKLGGTVPLWHCSGCMVITGARSYDVENTMYSHCTQNYANDSSFQTLVDQTVANINPGYEYRNMFSLKQEIQGLKQEVETLINSERELRQRIEQAETAFKDPLAELRSRVEKFELK
jgi:hypothetical protein